MVYAIIGFSFAIKNVYSLSYNIFSANRRDPDQTAPTTPV